MKKTDLENAVISANNISLGWAKVMLELTRPGVESITPMTLIVTELDADDDVIVEIPEIRAAVEEFLVAQDKRNVENVAWTIFPQQYLELSADRDEFFQLFIESFARVQDFNPRNNKRGSYFQRLVDFSGDGKGPNQLKWMLDQYQNHPKARRASKFQASTFDPARDYSATGQLEFPCLQQVSFTFFEEGRLQLNAFYATQQIARKAYGNYLGLARLGKFMAREMDLQFSQLNVFVGSAKMDVGKTHPNVVRLMEEISKFKE